MQNLDIQLKNTDESNLKIIRKDIKNLKKILMDEKEKKKE